jgi:hypothetical protein
MCTSTQQQRTVVLDVMSPTSAYLHGALPVRGPTVLKEEEFGDHAGRP